MKIKKSMSKAAIFGVVLALGLFLVSTVYAVNITVDGIKDPSWSGGGGQTPGVQNDANEAGITDGYDVEQFLYTNNTTDMFFAIDTYANTIYSGTPFPTVVICLDTDNNVATGGSYANCNGMSGIDRSIVLTGFSGTLLSQLYDGDPNTGTDITGTATMSQAYATDFTEVSVDLASLGLTGAACVNDIQAAIYFDNGITDPDDNTPDTGLITMSCGSPTAVAYKSAQTSVNQMSDLLNWGITVVFGFTLGLFMVRRKKQDQSKQ